MLKRPVNARAHRKPAFLQTGRSNQNSTLALESLARLRQWTRSQSSEKLSYAQMRYVMLSAAVPMVGFGFMDNFVMIQAGSYIDSTIGVQFGLATMTAAAMGQVVSDVSGVLFGGTLERILNPIIKRVNLSDSQKALKIVPRLRLAGGVVGVVLGCTLGASALLFAAPSTLDGEDSRSEKENLTRFLGVVDEMVASDLPKGTSCTVYMSNNSVAAPVEKSSLAKQCQEQASTILGDDNSFLFVPVASSIGGDALAVLELSTKDSATIFSNEDIADAERVARHIGIFMDRM